VTTTVREKGGSSCGQMLRVQFKKNNVKLTTHLHLVPKSRIRAAILLFPQYVYMACCLVKHRNNFTKKCCIWMDIVMM